MYLIRFVRLRMRGGEEGGKDKMLKLTYKFSDFII